MKKLVLSILTVLLAATLFACGKESHELKMGQAYYAAHGTKAFAVATVVVEDETIVAAYIDEFQFLASDTVTGVPNSETLNSYVKEGYSLASKRVNNATYSANMAGAGSTQELAVSYAAIEEYVTGKTVSELTTLTAKEKEEVLDVVTSSTLVDTKGYISAILAAVENAKTNKAVSYEGKLEELKLNQVYGAAHGTKCFTISAALTAGETIVAAYIDELQYLAADSATGCPNADNREAFGSYIKEGYVIASKRVNNALYSANMAGAGSTVEIAENYNILQDYAAGKTAAELEGVDTVTSCTLVDTAGYLAEIATASK